MEDGEGTVKRIKDGDRRESWSMLVFIPLLVPCGSDLCRQSGASLGGGYR